MPLVTLSKLLSSKTLARTSQLYPSSISDSSAEHTGSLSLKSSPRASSSVNNINKFPMSPKQEKGGSVRSRDRASKAFTFSLDPFSVVASFRTRPKSRACTSTDIHPDGSLSSRAVSHQSQSVYSGYEDEDYGEPEVDAEEIRRPSGLGRRASLMDICMDVGEEVDKYSINHESVKEIRPVQNATKDEVSRKSISDTSDSESLVEIRYPSGLGNIKLTLPIESQRPLSTYPHFEPSVVDLSKRVEDEARTPVPCKAPFMIPLPSSPSVSFSTLLPILGPYLSPLSLTSLTLVDRAIGKEARALLWKSITVSLTISSAQAKKLNVDGRASGNLLDAINTGKVGHHIKSLELACRLESTATRLSSNFPRSRPPPLILVPKTTTSLRSKDTLMAPHPSTQSRSAPLPSKVVSEMKPTHIVAPTTTTHSSGEDDPVTLSKVRRASLLLRNSSLTLKNNVPDALRASAAKIRPTSLRLPRTLSLLRSRSSDVIRNYVSASDGASPSHSHNPSPRSDVAETSIVSDHLPSHIPEAEKMSTPERHSVVVTDVAKDSSPRSAPLPSTGWTPPAEWYATPSLLSSPPSSFCNSVRSSLQIRPRPPSLTNLNHHSDLRLSPSLPSLRALNSPPPSWSMYHPPTYEDAPPLSPMTVVPSPVTPYSAISLSAFPLPPPSITPTSALPFRPNTSPLYSPISDHGISASSSTASATSPTREPRDDHVDESGCGLPKALVTALDAMVNLERVTIKYVSSETGGPMSNQMSYTRMRESIDLSLVKKANETLGMVFPRLESLRHLRVVCQKPQEEVCRRQWEGVTPSSKNFDFNVTCVSDLDATNMC